MNEKISIRKQVVYSYIGKYSALAIQFIATIVISRLLTPEDIGVYAIAYALLAIAHIFRDFGITNYLIQEKNLTYTRIKSANSLMMISSWFVAAIIFISSDYVATYYESSGISEVFQVIGFSFIVLPFSAVIRANLERNFAFRVLMYLEITKSLVYVVVVVVLAYHGYRYLSMAWASLASILFDIVLLQFFRPKGYPVLPGMAEMKYIFSYCASSLGATLLSLVSQYMPELVFGKTQGMHTAGVYNRGMAIVSLFDRLVVEGVKPVLLPYFSEKNRQGKSLKNIYIYINTIVTGIAWPAYAYIALMADEIIYILFGTQWEESVVILQILCIRAAIGKHIAFLYPVFHSIGQPRKLLKLEVYFVVVQFLFLYMAIDYGFYYMLWTLVLSQVLRILYAFVLLKNEIGISQVEFFKPFAVNILMTVMIITPVYYFQMLMDSNQLMEIFFSGLIFVCMFLFVVTLLKHEIKYEITRLFSVVYKS